MKQKQKNRAKSIHYTSDALPGIRREKRGGKFGYIHSNGKVVTSPKVLRRIADLAIPPAYSDVWICPDEHGHLQATGRDSKKRKQYRYHPEWVKAQDIDKFKRVYLFGKTLPLIRRRVTEDLKKPSLDKTCVLAALVRIMDQSHVRVGNDMYAKEHNTFGLTTLRKRHARVHGDKVSLSFEGKNQTPWRILIDDPKVIKIVKKCADIRGYELFKYMDEKGIPHSICSEDFNEYLKNISGHDFTAKDFRSWAACKETFGLLASLVEDEHKIDRKKTIAHVVKTVAKMMGHTIAICKKSYIHPLLLKAWKEGDLERWLEKKNSRSGEKLFLKWWKEHIKQDKVL